MYNGSPWFAIQTRVGYEKLVAEVLSSKGFDRFLPLYRASRRWSDRIREMELPLFPGYLFCRLNLTDRLAVITTRGVHRIVGIGGTPVPVDEREVTAIRTIVNSRLRAQVWPLVEVGQVVRIEYGPLCGLEGFLVNFKNRNRLVVSVPLLQRSVAVEVDSMQVRPVEAHLHVPPSLQETFFAAAQA